VAAEVVVAAGEVAGATAAAMTTVTEGATAADMVTMPATAAATTLTAVGVLLWGQAGAGAVGGKMGWGKGCQGCLCALASQRHPASHGHGSSSNADNNPVYPLFSVRLRLRSIRLWPVRL
jgi:hypothetical protein